MRVRGIAGTVLVSCALVAAPAGLGLAAQAHDPQHAAADKAKPPAEMAAKDHAMMAEREKMMAGMKAADQQLDAVITKMNTASAMQQPAATAAVVTAMVTQSRTMRERMMKMRQGMMQHLMEHMQAGPASMAACPMMKPMADTKP